MQSLDTKTTLSTEDIEPHNHAGDCWVAVDGKVWDVTDFLSIHPGGSEGELAISSQCDEVENLHDQSHSTVRRLRRDQRLQRNPRPGHARGNTCERQIYWRTTNRQREILQIDNSSDNACGGSPETGRGPGGIGYSDPATSTSTI